MSPGPQLREIALPPEPGLWPWPPGVWLLLVLALAVVFWGAWHLRAWWQRRRRRQRWLQAFDAICQTPQSSPQERVAQASELLRRLLRQLEPQRSALAGQAWIDWLRAQGGEASDSDLQLLAYGPFRGALSSDQANQALSCARGRLQHLLARLP